jgi:predicted Abi (CAAX) family protease
VNGFEKITVDWTDKDAVAKEFAPGVTVYVKIPGLPLHEPVIGTGRMHETYVAMIGTQFWPICTNPDVPYDMTGTEYCPASLYRKAN